MKLHFRESLILLFATLSSVALPFVVVHYVPSSDIPQHLAQIRLFLETLSGKRAGALEIQWFSPNTLVYLLVGIMWAVFPPIVAGKMTMLALALLWSGSIFVLAGAYGRPWESAVTASLLTFSASFYWGFINFLSGWPLFVLWLLLLKEEKGAASPSRTLILMGLCALALMLAHSLWFAAAMGVLALQDVLRRTPVRRVLLQAAAVAPVFLLALLWYPHISASRLQIGFDTDPHWLTAPWERLNPAWIVDQALGGLTGPWDMAVLTFLILWGALAIVTNRASLQESWDRDIGYAGILVLAVGLFAPDKFLNTITFASRWMPVAFVLLLVALPPPAIPRVARIVFPMAALIAYSAATAYLWRHYETEELSGLTESLRSVPDNSRTLGLDFMKKSEYVRRRPFLQTFAYSQVLHGGELNFSFVIHGSGIVANAAPPVFTWTPNLEWSPEGVDVRDFRQFDIAIVNGTDEMHAKLLKFGVVSPITTQGRWRAYRCIHLYPQDAGGGVSR